MSTNPIFAETLVRAVHQKTLRLERGDLTAWPADAVVFYAREDLQLGSGFGSAIRSRGGATVQNELDAIGRVEMGEACVTTGGNLAASHVIHACGPKFHEADLEAKLRRCMSSALGAAAAKNLKTVAFPPMGAGFYGVPLELCATVMVDAIRDFLSRDNSLEEVIICVLDDREFEVFQKKVEAL